jgi:hypothetical protein
MSKAHKKYLVLKPEVSKIFDDLESYLDHCRFNMVKFDERDLYRSDEWRYSQGVTRNVVRKGYQGKNPTPNYQRPR